MLYYPELHSNAVRYLAEKTGQTEEEAYETILHIFNLADIDRARDILEYRMLQIEEQFGKEAYDRLYNSDLWCSCISVNIDSMILSDDRDFDINAIIKTINGINKLMEE